MTSGFWSKAGRKRGQSNFSPLDLPEKYGAASLFDRAVSARGVTLTSTTRLFRLDSGGLDDLAGVARHTIQTAGRSFDLSGSPAPDVLNDARGPRTIQHAGVSEWTRGGYIASMQYMPAVLVAQAREVRDDGSIIEIVVWELSEPLAPSTHRYKYRLYYGAAGVNRVRYDNERGKGDHRHLGDREDDYAFTTVEQLLADFERDVNEWS